MDLSDNSAKPGISSNFSKIQVYENVVFENDVSERNQVKGTPGKDEETYEQLRFEEIADDKSNVSFNGMKCMIISMFVMLIVLYIAVIAVIVIVVVPKDRDGGWSDWENWSTCSVTCGTGLKRKSRTCDNPERVSTGKDCDGSSQDVELCFTQICEDGVWSDWEDWNSCSVSCGTGLKKRQRACKSSQTFATDKYCNGSSEDVDLCYEQSCNEHYDIVAFHAKKAANTSLYDNQVIVFTDINMNIGDAYNNTNGYFTAPVSGIYCLTSHLCGVDGHRIGYVIKIGSKTGTSGLFKSNSQGTCESFSTNVQMQARDRAWVTIDIDGSSFDLLYEDSDAWNYFTGFLIRKTK